jgi:hypothetical protein
MQSSQKLRTLFLITVYSLLFVLKENVQSQWSPSSQDTFTQSCNWCVASGNLYGYCEGTNGSATSQVDSPNNCAGFIFNNNGTLQCSTEALRGGSAWPSSTKGCPNACNGKCTMAVPNNKNFTPSSLDSFQEICSWCSPDNLIIIANCMKDRTHWSESAYQITIAECGSTGISTSDGNLACGSIPGIQAGDVENYCPVSCQGQCTLPTRVGVPKNTESKKHK